MIMPTSTCTSWRERSTDAAKDRRLSTTQPCEHLPTDGRNNRGKTRQPEEAPSPSRSAQGLDRPLCSSAATLRAHPKTPWDGRFLPKLAHLHRFWDRLLARLLPFFGSGFAEYGRNRCVGGVLKRPQRPRDVSKVLRHAELLRKPSISRSRKWQKSSLVSRRPGGVAIVESESF